MSFTTFFTPCTTIGIVNKLLKQRIEDGLVTIAEGGEIIVEMWLCEQDAVVFRPNEIVRFTPKPGCDKCDNIVQMYEGV